VILALAKIVATFLPSFAALPPVVQHIVDQLEAAMPRFHADRTAGGLARPSGGWRSTGQALLWDHHSDPTARTDVVDESELRRGKLSAGMLWGPEGQRSWSATSVGSVR